MQRWRLNASRNIGLSATLSARPLKVAGNCFTGFFHQCGMSPVHRHEFGGAPVGGPHDLDGVRWRDVVMGLEIASGAREVVQVVNVAPSVALGEASAQANILPCAYGQLACPRGPEPQPRVALLPAEAMFTGEATSVIPNAGVERGRKQSRRQRTPSIFSLVHLLQNLAT